MHVSEQDKTYTWVVQDHRNVTLVLSYVDTSCIAYMSTCNSRAYAVHQRQEPCCGTGC